MQALILLVLSAWAAQDPREGAVHEAALVPAERAAAVRRAVEGVRGKAGIPGLSAAIVLEGRLAWADGFGLSDVENSVPARAGTSYRWASVSKPVAAIAVMQLVERAKIDLDAPIQNYVPGFPDKGVKVTARHLLCHQSGIRHYKSRDELASTRRFARLEEGLAFFKDDPLLFDPGTRYQYTTFGYTLLGCAVEKAAAMPFMEYLRQHVFEPAGMASARDDSVQELIPHRAQGYVRAEGKLRNSELADTSYKIPGGGLCGSVLDLARLVAACLEGRLLKRETQETMFVPQKTADGKVTRHGLGWTVGQAAEGRLIGHGGAQQRVSAWVGFVPEKKAGVVLLANLEGAGGELTRLSHELLRIVLAGK